MRSRTYQAPINRKPGNTNEHNRKQTVQTLRNQTPPVLYQSVLRPRL